MCVPINGMFSKKCFIFHEHPLNPMTSSMLFVNLFPMKPPVFPIMILYLVGGLEHFLFFHILGMSSSQLTFIFFRGVAQPPTRYVSSIFH